MGAFLREVAEDQAKLVAVELAPLDCRASVSSWRVPAVGKALLIVGGIGVALGIGAFAGQSLIGGRTEVAVGATSAEPPSQPGIEPPAAMPDAFAGPGPDLEEFLPAAANPISLARLPRPRPTGTFTISEPLVTGSIAVPPSVHGQWPEALPANEAFDVAKFDEWHVKAAEAAEASADCDELLLSVVLEDSVVSDEGIVMHVECANGAVLPLTSRQLGFE